MVQRPKIGKNCVSAFSIVCAFVFFGLFLNACEVSNSFSSDKAIAGSGELLKVTTVLQKNCTSCHYHDSFFEHETNEEWLAGVDGDNFTPGNAETSVFYQRIDSNSMPPSGSPMSDDDKAIIRTWINTMPPPVQ